MASPNSNENNWPQINLSESAELLELYLHSSRDALKQAIEGSRAIYTRTSSILTQSSALAVAAFGAISVINKAIPKNFQNLSPYVMNGLIVSCVFWTLAALVAAVGMRTQQMGSIGIDEEILKNNEVMFSCSTAEAKLYLLKITYSSIKISQKGAKKAANWLNCSTLCIAFAPLAGLLTIGWQFFDIADKLTLFWSAL